MVDTHKFPGKPCSVCGVERWYKTETNARRGADSPCRSCANSMKLGGEGVSYNEHGEKLCLDCNSHPREYSSLCKGCASVRRKSYFQNYMRFDRYGITKEWFESRFNGKCEICGNRVNANSVNIDHCHNSNSVRGLLCGLCNKGLGAFKDNPVALLAAVNYLEKSK